MRSTLNASLIAVCVLGLGCRLPASSQPETEKASAPSTRGPVSEASLPGSVCTGSQHAVLLEALEEAQASSYQEAVLSAIRPDRARYHEACWERSPGAPMPDGIAAVRLVSCEPARNGEGFTVAVELCCLPAGDEADTEPPMPSDGEEHLIPVGSADCGDRTARVWALSLHDTEAASADEAVERAETRLESAHYAKACGWSATGGGRGRALAARVVTCRSAVWAKGFYVDVELCCEAGERSPRTVGSLRSASLGGSDSFDAARRGNVEEMIAILSADPGLLHARANDGSTLLHRAANHPLACLLVLRGADVDARTGSGETPLHFMAFAGRRDTAGLLLAEGADVDAEDNSGATPLMRSNRAEMSAWLLDRGADLEARDSSGATALQIAAFRGREDLASLLLERGADADSQDLSGRSALDVAQNPAMAGLLRRGGAR